MNVVTSNQNKEIIDRLDIDIIKRIDGEFELSDLLSKFFNLYFNKMIIDITSIKDYGNMDVIKELSTKVDPNRVILVLVDDPIINSSVYMSNLVKCGFYNFTRNYEGIMYLYNTPNTLENVKHFILSDDEVARQEKIIEKSIASTPINNMENVRQVIGLVNLTNHAGASTLTNLLVRQLNDVGIRSIGIEMFRQDLIYYRNPDLFSCMSKLELEQKLKDSDDVTAIIIDVNDYSEIDKVADKILYLTEPSYIMLTKLLKKNKNAFAERKNDYIVLNKSFVNDQEIPDFEYETKIKVFDNIPPINDRNQSIKEINDLIQKLGFNIRT